MAYRYHLYSHPCVHTHHSHLNAWVYKHYPYSNFLVVFKTCHPQCPNADNQRTLSPYEWFSDYGRPIKNLTFNGPPTEEIGRQFTYIFVTMYIIYIFIILDFYSGRFTNKWIDRIKRYYNGHSALGSTSTTIHTMALFTTHSVSLSLVYNQDHWINLCLLTPLTHVVSYIDPCRSLLCPINMINGHSYPGNNKHDPQQLIMLLYHRN